MSKQISIFLGLLFVSFFWTGAFFYTNAHEGEDHPASYNLAAVSIAQDEAVDAASLGVGSSDILPGHAFYFLKNASRGFRSALTFSAEKKAELKLQFANEKIVEAQLLLDRGDKIRAAEHLKSYEKDLAGAKGVADKEKLITQIFKHQGVIDKIEKEAGAEKSAGIKEVREKGLEHIAEAVAGAEDKEAAKNALISATSGDGSSFKPLRNLEVLKAVEEKVPEQAKEAVRAAQENAVKRFKNDYDKGTEQEKAALTDYVKTAGGDASRYIEAFKENKEVLGEELSGKLLSAGEEKRVAEETKPPTSSPITQVAPTECIPAAPAKPASEQHSYGTMTITPEISKAAEDNTVTISLNTHIDALAIQLEDRPISLGPEISFGKAGLIDWGPKQSELNGGKGTTITGGEHFIRWDTYGYPDDNKQPQKRPQLRAQKYWIKLKASQKTVTDRADHEGQAQIPGYYGWKEVGYKISYVVGDTAVDKDIKTVGGKDFFFVGGPQFPTGKIVRAGTNTQSPADGVVTVKAGEPFEIEARPTGWQGGTMAMKVISGGRVTGPDSFTISADQSAVWKVFPTGLVKGFVTFTNDCNDRFFTSKSSVLGDVSYNIKMQSFEIFPIYDFKGLKKEKARLTFHGAIAYALDFTNPKSSLTINPGIQLMDGQSVLAEVPDFAITIKAVFKDNPQELVKNVLIAPKGKAQLEGSASAVTKKDEGAYFTITAPKVTKEEVTRGIVLKASSPDIPGLTFEQNLLFTNVVIEVTKPIPVVEKKEEPKVEPKIEPKVEPKVEPKIEPKTEAPKPYEGSPPLIY